MYLTFPNMKLLSKFIITVLLCMVSIMGYSQADTQFWFAAPDLQQAHGDRPIFLRMAASKLAATVTISIPANPGFSPISIAIAANSSQSVDLTSYIGIIENGLPNTVYQKGLLITSTVPISCYYDVANGYNGDMYALKGKNALGKKFTIPLQMDFNNRTATNASYTTDFIIVATEDNTSITISPKNNLIGRAGPFTIVLNRGETYVCSSASNLGSLKPGGTTVTSNKPIAISTKDDSIALPGQSCSDTAGDQLLPDDLAGNEFIVVKGYLNITPDHYYVYATSNATTIKINGNNVGTINAGEYYTGKLTDVSCYIESDKPTHVFHITGFGCEVGGAVIPPIRCTGSTSVNVTRATATEGFFLNVIAPTDIINAFKLNGSQALIDPSIFQAIPGS